MHKSVLTQEAMHALALRPGDKPCQLYIERSKVFQLMPPPEDWEGVFDLSSK